MKILLIIFVLFIGQQSFGQISGKITAVDGVALPSVNVTLRETSDSSIKQTTVTDKSGAYLLNAVKEGKYLLSFSSAGYASVDSIIWARGEMLLNLGTTIMKNRVRLLNEVVVTASKPRFQQDPRGTVVNLDNNIFKAGSNLLQVVERSPGVVINRRDNGIELNGKAGVLIMLDGKPIRMPAEQVVDMLEGMSADDVSSIELLNTPPANYDAEGSAGIINIITKTKKTKGTIGSVTMTGGYGKAEKASANAGITHTSPGIALDASYNVSRNNTISSMFIESAQHMPFLGGDVSVLAASDARFQRTNHNAKAGADIKINPRLTIGGTFSYNGIRSSGHTKTDAGYTVLPDSLMVFQGYNQGFNHWNNFLTSAYLQQTTSNGARVNFETNYLLFKNQDRYGVESSFTDKNGVQANNSNVLFAPEQQGYSTTNIRVMTAKLDYSRTLGSTKLETGLKGTYTRSGSVSGIISIVDESPQANPETSNDMSMQESIAAAYLSASTRLGASIDAIAGLRYEYSTTTMDDAKAQAPVAVRNLGALFPNLLLTKKLGERSSFQLSYSRRISRPSYNDLASYVGYSDPTAVYTGNPLLKPTLTSNVKVGYVHGSYSLSLLFSRDRDPIARYQLTESPQGDMLYISPQNMLWQDDITLQLNVPVNIQNWWQMNYSIAPAFHQYKLTYTAQPLTNSYFGYSLNFSQTFKLPKQFGIEFSGRYNSDSYSGTRKIQGFAVLDLGIKKDLQKNRGSLRLSIADLLGQERYDIRYGTLTREAFDIRSHVVVSTETAKFPVFKLSFTRSFGKTTEMAKKATRGSDREETERVIF